MEAGGQKRGRRRLRGPTASPAHFSQSPKPVLVEVSTEDGAYISSKPGRGETRFCLQQLRLLWVTHLTV